MRLVIRNRYGSAAGGLRRYNGSGIFSSIGRKLFSSGLKKVINVASKANISQKVADAVVNGAKSVGQKLGKTVGQKVTKVAGDKIQSIVGDKFQSTINNKKQKIIKKKRPLASEEQQLLAPPPTKQIKFDNINHLIDNSIDGPIRGSGICLD
jgi:hypothetical protein